MKDSTAAALVYAAVLGVVCAGLITATASWTAPARRANRRAERLRHVLAALGVEVEADADARRLLDAFEREVRTVRRGEWTVYVREADGARAAVFSGRGLWGPIRGVLALEPDGRTIRAVRIFEQAETPGLGGEIAGEAFRRRFEGKRVFGPDERIGVRIVAERPAVAENEVDAISGATKTSRRLEGMLTEAARRLAGEGGDG